MWKEIFPTEKNFQSKKACEIWRKKNKFEHTYVKTIADILMYSELPCEIFVKSLHICGKYKKARNCTHKDTRRLTIPSQRLNIFPSSVFNEWVQSIQIPTFKNRFEKFEHEIWIFLSQSYFERIGDIFRLCNEKYSARQWSENDQKVSGPWLYLHLRLWFLKIFQS